MNTLFADPVFQGYALSVSIVLGILYGLGFHTARIRAQRKVVVNAEDVAINVGATVAEIVHVDVQRIKRAHINLLENAVPFFAIGLLYTFTTPSVGFAWALFGVFVSVRLLHALFYLNAKQPFRTLSFAVGALVNLTMAVQVVRAVIAGG
jgi:glutathione S-transferase